MKEVKCPSKATCLSYRENECDACAVHLLAEKYERKIARMRKQIEVLKIPPMFRNREYLKPVIAHQYTWKPCPFCGSMDMHVLGGNSWDMICHGCGANVGFFHEKGDLNGQDFVDAWNRRANDDA